MNDELQLENVWHLSWKGKHSAKGHSCVMKNLAVSLVASQSQNFLHWVVFKERRNVKLCERLETVRGFTESGVLGGKSPQDLEKQPQLFGGATFPSNLITTEREEFTISSRSRLAGLCLQVWGSFFLLLLFWIGRFFNKIMNNILIKRWITRWDI